MKRRRWRELTPAQRRGTVIAGTVQFTMAAGAWWDLAHRPAEQVNGSKPVWALVIGVNFIGPIAYFLWGRTR